MQLILVENIRLNIIFVIERWIIVSYIPRTNLAIIHLETVALRKLPQLRSQTIYIRLSRLSKTPASVTQFWWP